VIEELTKCFMHSWSTRPARTKTKNEMFRSQKKRNVDIASSVNFIRFVLCILDNRSISRTHKSFIMYTVFWLSKYNCFGCRVSDGFHTSRCFLRAHCCQVPEIFASNLTRNKIGFSYGWQQLCIVIVAITAPHGDLLGVSVQRNCSVKFKCPTQ
jgi:hypothetical protein